jgi:hypothetical protein
MKHVANTSPLIATVAYHCNDDKWYAIIECGRDRAKIGPDRSLKGSAKAARKWVEFMLIARQVMTKVTPDKVART